MNTISVLVLMSTYNGEKYLVEQLDSIFGQVGVAVHLLVRDDGSTDSSLSILRDYKSCYEDALTIIEGKNLGWKASFHSLIQDAAEKYSNYKYFAFSDQDDIWLPEKLSSAISRINTLPEGPRLYCSNQYIYRNGEKCGLIFKEPGKVSVKGCLVRNYATGCTILFNDQLLKCLAVGSPSISIAHDYWCYMVAALCGSVVIDENAYILYRQHSANQIGMEKNWLGTWKNRLKSMSKLIGNHNREAMAKELIRLHGSQMTLEGRSAVDKLANYRSSLSKRISLLIDKGYTLARPSNDFWLKLRIILGRV